AIEQVWDYALDLKNFHAASHAAIVVPILVATESALPCPAPPAVATDGVYEPIAIGAPDLRSTIEMFLGLVDGQDLDARAWENSPYLPTPTIIEAARALYANHSVEAIARSDAEAR